MVQAQSMWAMNKRKQESAILRRVLRRQGYVIRLLAISDLCKEVGQVSNLSNGPRKN